MTTNWTIRRAVAADIDALTWIAIDAFPHDPQWNYRYPHAKRFPQDHHKYTRLRYGEWLAANEGQRCVIMVAECPSLEDPSVSKVVAFSIWRIPSPGGDIAGDVDKMKPPNPVPNRRDSNSTHMTAYRVASEIVHKKYFARVLGENQMELAQLATHPSYSRLGAGSTLLRWGMDLAKTKGWPITLFAGPQGYSLYQAYGFRQVVMVTVQAQGEEETLRFPGLVWKPDGSGARTPRQGWDTLDSADLRIVVDSTGRPVQGKQHT